MFDFFKAVHEIYDDESFCDVEIVSCSTSNEETYGDRVKCHSLVLSSAVPNIRSLLEANTSEDPTTIIIVQNDFELVCVRETLNNIYDCFAGISVPNPENW